MACDDEKLPPSTPPAPLVQVSPDTPVLRVGARVVTAAEFMRLLGPAPLRRSREPESERRHKLLEDLERTELLAAEAERRGIFDQPAIKRHARETQIARMLEDLFGENGSEVAPVTDDDVRDYYDAHLVDEFSAKERVRARHILLKTAAQAKVLLKRMHEKPENLRMFGELAVEHSQDESTSARGGDLGVFTRQPPAPIVVDVVVSASLMPKRVPEAVRAATFALAKPGDISEVVHSEDGYHLVQLSARMPAMRYQLEQVQQLISKRLREERQAAALEAFTKRLYGEANVKIDRAKLDLVQP